MKNNKRKIPSMNKNKDVKPNKKRKIEQDENVKPNKKRKIPSMNKNKDVKPNKKIENENNKKIEDENEKNNKKNRSGFRFNVYASLS